MKLETLHALVRQGMVLMDQGPAMTPVKLAEYVLSEQFIPTSVVSTEIDRIEEARLLLMQARDLESGMQVRLLLQSVISHLEAALTERTS